MTIQCCIAASYYFDINNSVSTRFCLIIRIHLIPFCPLIYITFFKMSEFRFLRKTRAFKHVYTRVFNTHLARGRQRYWSCRVSQVEADFYRSEMVLQTSLVLSLSFSRTICCGAALYGLSDTTETPHACVGQKPGLGQHVSLPGSPQEHCPTWTFSFCFQLFFLLLPLCQLLLSGTTKKIEAQQFYFPQILDT